VAGTIVLIAFYLVALFAISSPMPVKRIEARRSADGAAAIHWFDEGSLRPYVFALKERAIPARSSGVYVPDTSRFRSRSLAAASRTGCWESSRPTACLPSRGAKPGESCSVGNGRMDVTSGRGSCS
jgi:hypothetical protein